MICRSLKHAVYITDNYIIADTQPTDDYMKRLGNVVQTRMQRVGGEIKEFVQKTRTSRYSVHDHVTVYVHVHVSNNLL